jgi:uncharacterized membrane protein
MKQNDIILVIVVVFISGVSSFLLSNLLFGSPEENRVKAEVVEPISAEFAEVDKRYFNNKSINPTQLIQIGQGNNQQPF